MPSKNPDKGHVHVHGENCAHDHDHAHDHGPPQKPVMVNKVGRNDPCPCGSGKKHKKCCAAKAR